MDDVIEFWFDTNVALWSMIVQNWILSISVIVVVIGWIINLVNSTRNSR